MQRGEKNHFSLGSLSLKEELKPLSGTDWYEFLMVSLDVTHLGYSLSR